MPALREADALQGAESADGRESGGDVAVQAGLLPLWSLARRAFSPSRSQLEQQDEGWSEGIARQAVWLSGLVPFEQAERILQEIGQVNISRCSIWRRSRAWGAQFKGLEEAERAKANALPEKWQPPSREVEPDRRMGVAMDGMMVHIRQEGWKELKVGAVFDIEVRLGKDAHTHEPVQMAHAVHNSYAAHLGGPEVFGEMVFAEARRRGWEQAQDTQVVADGAAWIWNQADLHFGAEPATGGLVSCRPAPGRRRQVVQGRGHGGLSLYGSTAARRRCIRAMPSASPVNWSRRPTSCPTPLTICAAKRVTSASISTA